MKMNDLLRDSFKELQILSARAEGIINISGISEGRSSFAAAAVMAGRCEEHNALVITRSFEAGKRFAADLSCFYEGRVILLPEERGVYAEYDAKSRWMLEQKLEAANALLKEKGVVVVAPVVTSLTPMISPTEFKNEILKLSVGDDIDPEGFREKMTLLGYERVGMTEAKGEFSIRGDIIDIFPPDAERPYRIELFDTEIDSIRTFDPLTQRSVEKVKEIELFPAGEVVDKDRNSYIWDYTESGDMIILDDYNRLLNAADLMLTEYTQLFDTKRSGKEKKEDKALPFGLADDLLKGLEKRLAVILTPFRGLLKGIEKLDGQIDINSSAVMSFNGDVKRFVDELKVNRKHGIRNVVFCGTLQRKKNMENLLEENDCRGIVKIFPGELSAGMSFPSEGLAVFSDAEVFKVSTSRRKKRRKSSDDTRPIRSFIDVKPGDYVVHELHGIGRFDNIEQLEIQGVRKDYMKIRYAGADVLYVPVEQMHMVQCYIGAQSGDESGKSGPRVNKLNSGDWAKTKARARAAVEEMARRLLELSAERMNAKGHPFPPDDEIQKAFEDAFPYAETHDQLKCSREIKREMELDIPMDHLLCGDVGYGKTEVAARAVCKCVNGGKQAAVLVPTTILANQHYNTFLERFKDLPFKVEMMSRFRSPARQKEILEEAAQGKVDILVGTHRLLSKDVKFKDLGLLVIDEEQRFGVEAKERLKELKTSIDVLTLSATPIPRTLHMSLSGIRSMSVIEEPPEERYPVQTFVLEQHEEIVAQVIERELARGGQVYVVYNRVRGINGVAEAIRRLVPDARVEVGHGQMSERALEDIMIRFEEHDFDVLVATTIIESGIDIKNANTMIILDADRFGLTQLYQLRGRVGRSDKMAYAYLMYQKDKVLTEVAQKRLTAIREFTEFGSGFKVAMRDLEIRGAGNLLGTEQSGHMENIGYEMYCQLVEEAVRTLKGGQPSPETAAETLIDIGADAYIPEEYITEDITRLEIYKRISEIKSRADIEEMSEELDDRFGKLPPEVHRLIYVAYSRYLGQKAFIEKIYTDGGGKRVVCQFPSMSRISRKSVAALTKKFGMKFSMNSGRKPYLALTLRSPAKAAEELTSFLEVINDTRN